MAKMLIALVELGCSKEILTPEHLCDAVHPELLPLSIQRVFEYLLLSSGKASSTTCAERLLPPVQSIFYHLCRASSTGPRRSRRRPSRRRPSSTSWRVALVCTCEDVQGHKAHWPVWGMCMCNMLTTIF